MLNLLALLAPAAAVVQMDFSISNSHGNRQLSPAHQSLYKRHLNNSLGDNSTVEPVVNASLTTSYNFYHGKLLFGQPPQEIEVLLDTGSPITWVYGPEGSFHNATMFYPNQSSTFSKVNYSLSASYGSGEYLGYWGKDLVASPQFVSGNTTYNATGNSSSGRNTNYSVPYEFGVVTNFATSAGAPGLLGLGPHIKSAGPQGYLSLPEAYAKNNITSSSAFSVFLEEEVGRFLFGGVDLRYAQLPLYKFSKQAPLYGSPSSAGSTSWEISLSTIRLNNTAPYTVRSSVTLDTGSPVNLLPPGFVDAVGKSYGLTKYGRYETYYINGSSSHVKGNLTFNFNGLELEADIRNFLVPGEYIWLDDGPKNVTALSLMGSPNYLLGDAFFKSVYTVLDPATGDVIIGKRTNNIINGTNSTNASTVVPFSQLSKNVSAVVNASILASASGSSDVTTSTTHRAVTISTPVGVLANQYLGSVSADKAASMTGGSSASASSSSSSSGTAAGSSASGSSAKSSSSSSSSSSNSAIANLPKIGLLLFAASAALLI